MTPTIALVVSGHGYGHSVRCAQVADALLARGAHVMVHSDAPRWLYPAGVEYTATQTDVGVVQRGGLEMDIDATREAWVRFLADWDARVAEEAKALDGVDLVIGDVPALAFAAAARAGIPSAALTNFGWDWIYAIWPDFEPVVARIQESYCQAERLLRLPLHSTTADAFAAFDTIEDVPLIARRARRSRDAVRSEYGLPLTRPVVLMSFGGFAAQGLDIGAFGRWNEFLFIAVPPVSTTAPLPDNVIALSRQPDDYVSLLAACDAVITKPGYGIVADCLANRVSVLFTDRGPFREYPVLADALVRLGNARYIPSEKLLKGEIGPYLDDLLSKPNGWTNECMNGADVVADRALELAGKDRGLIG